MYISIHKLKPKLFRATFFLDRTSNKKIPKTFFSSSYYSYFCNCRSRIVSGDRCDIFVNCLRLATKEEIDDMVAAKGFRDNWNGEGVNYVSDRLALEDMHPANVFIDTITGKPICIDCIVKFVNPQI